MSHMMLMLLDQPSHLKKLWTSQLSQKPRTLDLTFVFSVCVQKTWKIKKPAQTHVYII